MSKAILVMDMPSKCRECPVYKVVAGNELCQARIRATIVVGTLTAGYTKPSWCPLREVPQKKPYNRKEDVYDGIIRQGYNAAIDDILGKDV